MQRLVPAVIAVAALAAAGSQTDRQRRTLPLPQGQRLAIDLTVGDVRLEGEARADVAVEAVRRAPTGDELTKVPLEITSSSEGVAISARQAEGETNPAYRTDLIVRVPHDAIVAPVRLMEGRLEMSGLRGTVDAQVARGSIHARDVAGTLRLETVMGDVEVSGARLVATGLLRLRAFNGDVRLALAARPVHARIMALALNGTIRSDIPLTTKDAWGPRWGEASLGEGEPVISLDVVTGHIDIRVP